MMYIIEDGMIYSIDGAIKGAVGEAAWVRTDRIDSQKVIDISYTFDIEVGEYVETGRVEREEHEPAPELTPEQQRIAQLEADNLTLMEAIADLYEMMLGA